MLHFFLFPFFVIFTLFLFPFSPNFSVFPFGYPLTSQHTKCYIFLFFTFSSHTFFCSHFPLICPFSPLATLSPANTQSVTFFFFQFLVTHLFFFKFSSHTFFCSHFPLICPFSPLATLSPANTQSVIFFNFYIFLLRIYLSSNFLLTLFSVPIFPQFVCFPLWLPSHQPTHKVLHFFIFIFSFYTFFLFRFSSHTFFFSHILLQSHLYVAKSLCVRVFNI